MLANTEKLNAENERKREKRKNESFIERSKRLLKNRERKKEYDSMKKEKKKNRKKVPVKDIRL